MTVSQADFFPVCWKGASKAISSQRPAGALLWTVCWTSSEWCQQQEHLAALAPAKQGSCPSCALFPSLEMLMRLETGFTFWELDDGQIGNQGKVVLFWATLLSAFLCKLFLFGELSFDGLRNSTSILLNFRFGLRKAGVWSSSSLTVAECPLPLVLCKCLTRALRESCIEFELRLMRVRRESPSK